MSFVLVRAKNAHINAKCVERPTKTKIASTTPGNGVNKNKAALHTAMRGVASVWHGVPGGKMRTAGPEQLVRVALHGGVGQHLEHHDA